MSDLPPMVVGWLTFHPNGFGTWGGEPCKCEVISGVDLIKTPLSLHQEHESGKKHPLQVRLILVNNLMETLAISFLMREQYSGSDKNSVSPKPSLSFSELSLLYFMPRRLKLSK